jgi:hypothetical protein
MNNGAALAAFPLSYICELTQMAFSVFKKYPKAFGNLFSTQACFNFSFYGVIL